MIQIIFAGTACVVSILTIVIFWRIVELAGKSDDDTSEKIFLMNLLFDIDAYQDKLINSETAMDRVSFKIHQRAIKTKTIRE